MRMNKSAEEPLPKQNQEKTSQILKTIYITLII